MNALLSAKLAKLSPIVVLLAAGLAGWFLGPGFAILVLAAGALALVIWLLWSSVQSLTGESELSFEEALSLGARSVEEEQKRAVLRALKDLEFERSVGKISEQDYANFTARYRAEAKQLMQQLDENLGAARKQVEEELQRRLGTSNAASDADAEPAVEPAAAPAPERAAQKPLRTCGQCKTNNELDAHFCKKCGAALAAEGEQLCAACPARFASDLDTCPECKTPAQESP